jgi:predicted phage terminase large subunit-like protein
MHSVPSETPRGKPPPPPSGAAASSTDDRAIRAAIDGGHVGLLPWALQYLTHHFTEAPADFHWELADLADEHARLVVAAPRGHAKTTVLALAFPLYRAAVHREPFILIVSDTATQAEQRTSDLYAELLENDKLTNRYPHLALPERKDYADKRVKRTTRDFITLGGIRFTSAGAGQSLRGIKDRHQRPSLIVIDDLENDENVRTGDQRVKLADWFTKSLLNLPGPTGAQVLVIGTVLHPDGLLPGLLAPERASVWTQRRLQAIDESGAALWPAAWPIEKLEAKRAEIGPLAFASEFMNDPVRRGASVFQDAWYYDTLPPDPFREAVGIDFAYTAKSHADYSVAVRGRAVGDNIYITDLYRRQVEMPAFAAHLKSMSGIRMLARIGGTEKGIVDFLRRDGIRIETVPASTDKHAFAQPLAASWNTGKVLLPRAAPWVPALLDEVLSFTGVNDAHDDMVDALGALHHALFNKQRPNDPTHTRKIVAW